jgi:hypothetical protein
MTLRLPDSSTNTGIDQGASTSTSLVWTQVGSIVFLVYTITPISTGPIIIGNDKGTATTPRNDTPPTIPPTQVENGTSTTPTPGRNPQAAEFCPVYKKIRADKDDHPETEITGHQAYSRGLPGDTPRES